MKETHNRRVFLQIVTKGILLGTISFGYFKLGKSFELSPPGDRMKAQIPKINPAFRVNVLNDGSVELYTHKPGGEKVIYTFEGFEAETLLTILKHGDPSLYSQELGLKFNIRENDFISMAESTLRSMENKGFIYYGETMLVEIKEARNE
jgi:hypothetical protein